MDKKRLDLKFRPDDVFSKPIYGDLKPSSGFLIKVIRRRRKRHVPGPSSTEYIGEPTVEMVGAVRSMFKFEGLLFNFHLSLTRQIDNNNFFAGICDYQYLPLGTHLGTNEAQFLYDDIMPNSLLSPDWLK